MKFNFLCQFHSNLQNFQVCLLVLLSEQSKQQFHINSTKFRGSFILQQTRGVQLPSVMTNICLNSTWTISMNLWRSICFITGQTRQLLKLNTSPPTEAVAKSKPVQPRGVSLIRQSAGPYKILHQALTLLHDACLSSLVLV